MSWTRWHWPSTIITWSLTTLMSTFSTGQSFEKLIVLDVRLSLITDYKSIFQWSKDPMYRLKNMNWDIWILRRPSSRRQWKRTLGDGSVQWSALANSNFFFFFRCIKWTLLWTWTLNVLRQWLLSWRKDKVIMNWVVFGSRSEF